MANIQFDGTELINAIHVSGSAIPDLGISGSESPKYFIGSRKSYPFTENSEYTFKSNIICLKSEISASFRAKMEVYMYGPSFPSQNPLGYKIATYESEIGLERTEFRNSEVNFLALRTSSGSLRFVIYGGEWHFSEIGIFTARETGFNPDEAYVYLPVDGYRFEKLQFKVELADYDSNIVPVEVVTDPIDWDGGVKIFRGTDWRVYGRFVAVPSGSGPVFGSDASGSYIGIIDTNVLYPRPVFPDQLPTYEGPSLVTMYSGSIPFSGSTVGPAVGFQVVGFNSTSGSSYIDFNSYTGVLTIKGNIELLSGSILSSSFVSGVSGEGIVDYVPVWTATKTLGNSIISQSLNPRQLHISGSQIVTGSISSSLGFQALTSTSSFGMVGVGGITQPAATLHVTGSFAADTKSFIISHPFKTGYLLEHGVVEGPEHSIFIRGEVHDKDYIELPDYWTVLAKKGTITVQLTSMGGYKRLFVKKILDNRIVIGVKSIWPWKRAKPGVFYYHVQATRADVPNLRVERAR